MDTGDGWFFLGSDGQPQGPTGKAKLEGMVASGSLQTGSLVWRTGLTEWIPVESILAAESTQAAAPAKATLAAAPSLAKPADPEDELASFMGEISAIEAEAEIAKGGGSSPQSYREESPPTEEREFTDDDGTVYRWDSALRVFKPVAEVAPPAYTEEDMMFQPTEEKIPTVKEAKAEEEEPLTGVKRQRADAIEREKEKIAKAKEAEKAKRQGQDGDGWFELKRNTSVYVTGLPSDVSEEEVKAAFGRCGIIKENEDRTPRIKLYRDSATGMLKGDGLITFLKEPSVDIACQVMDGAPLRPGGNPMTVTVAKFEKKAQHNPKPKKPANKKAKKKQVEHQEKHLGWDGFDDYKKAEEVTVILKHMFTLQEMQADPSFRAELEEDVAFECSKLGAIERLRIFGGNSEGVISIRFKTEDAAAECIKVMNGRFFGGRQVVAHMYDGSTNYHVKAKESEEAQVARLEAYTRELEGDGS